MKKITIIVVALIILAVISLFLVSKYGSSLLDMNRNLMEKIVRIIPSTFLVLYRYNLFNKFMVFSGIFSASIILILIMLYWLFALTIKVKAKTAKIKLFFILVGIIGFIFITLHSYRHIKSRLFFAHGYKHEQIRQDEKVINCYLTSIKFDPLFVRPYVELINRYKTDRQYHKAIEIGETYLNFGNDHKITKLIGDLYAGIEDHQSAIDYYSKALVQAKDSLATNYNIAHNFYKLSNHQKAIEYCLEYPVNSRFLYLSAKSYLELGKYHDGIDAISQATQLNAADPQYWFVKGKLLSAIKKNQDALKSYEKAIWLKKEFPDVYIEMARILFEMGDVNSCKKYLNKAVYYDNARGDVLVWLELLKRGRLHSPDEIKRNEQIQIILPTSELKIEKDESAEVVVKVEVPIQLKNIELTFAEPYGWGVLCHQIKADKFKNSDGVIYQANYKIIGNRDCTVNLGVPWKLNLVAFNSESGDYNNEMLNVYVKDNREGKILFLITEDLECVEGPHANDATPDRKDLSVEETKVDIIKKGDLADKIANAEGLKWSHIVDIGSSYLMFEWLSETSGDSGWRWNWDGVRSYLNNSVALGNDVQLHIHAYNIPGSPNFNKRYNEETNQTIYYRSPRSSESWAHFYTDLGYFDDNLSRIGSLFRGIKLYEELLHSDFPNYRMLFFRAGEWEFGQDEYEIQKSIIALRKNKILAGSDAYVGKFGQNYFWFHRRVGENTYFSSFSNIRKPASSLLDIGILEILPIPDLHHYSYVRPIDDPTSIKKNYDLCFNSQGKINSGVHVLMEMYHINRINYGDKKWDSLDSDYGDWRRMKRHFKEFASYAIYSKPVTVSEAIIEYLDYYAPDIISLRINEQKIDETRYSYDIKMIGNDIPIDEKYIHYVAIKPPCYFLERIETITLLLHGKAIKTWNRISSYEDLEFEAKARTGYKIQVDLKTLNQ